MKTFPMFIQMEGRRVVINGGGEQAAQKMRLMLKTEAQIILRSVNAGLKPHQLPEQKCATWQDLAGVKLRHFVGYRVVHGPARRSAPTERRSCAGLWSNRSAVSAL
jgi:siroheme synthase (precorrin-2 oxidase/ferrochelatase)